MKRTLSFDEVGGTRLVVAASAFVACTYGLVRLAYGLFLPDVRTSLALTSSAAGLISSGASVVYCVGALCGLTAARLSRRLVAAATLTAALGSLGMAAAPGPAAFGVAAVLASAGAGLASPALVVVVARHVASGRRDRAQAAVNAGTGPGLVAAGLLALALSPHWRAAFVVGAAVTAAVGVGVLRLDHPGRAGGPAPGGADSGAVGAVGRAAGARALAAPAVAALLVGTTSAVAWTFGRAQLLDQGVGTSWSTGAWIAIGLGGLLTVPTAARVTGWPLARAWATPVAALTVGIAALGVGGRPWIGVGAGAVFGWGFMTATSILIVWAGRVLPGRAAEGTSVLFVVLVLGQAIGSSAAGAAADRVGLSAVFVVAGAVTAPAALLAARRFE